MCVCVYVCVCVILIRTHGSEYGGITLAQTHRVGFFRHRFCLHYQHPLSPWVSLPPPAQDQMLRFH